ncbi:MAG: thioredoxin family protein [Legionellales bacterium]|nr:thioredoxin family protein [Legionellales bacterium]
MVLTDSNQITLGSKAIDFTLEDHLTDTSISLSKYKGDNATVIIFMCNHCPYVLYIIDKFVETIKKFEQQGVKCIAINSNDVDSYPDDSPEKMKEFGLKHDMSFPYLFDETQEIAKSYQAACTPDIYVYDRNLLLRYHGRFDPSSPGTNNEKLSGKDLINALDCIISDKEIPVPQYNSVGCNIKWKK